MIMQDNINNYKSSQKLRMQKKNNNSANLLTKIIESDDINEV